MYDICSGVNGGSLKSISGTTFLVCQIINWKSINAVFHWSIVSTKQPKHLCGIHIQCTIKLLIATVCSNKFNRQLITYQFKRNFCLVIVHWSAKLKNSLHLLYTLEHDQQFILYQRSNYNSFLFQYRRQKQKIPTRDSFYYVNIIRLWVIHTLVTSA